MKGTGKHSLEDEYTQTQKCSLQETLLNTQLTHEDFKFAFEGVIQWKDLRVTKEGKIIRYVKWKRING